MVDTRDLIRVLRKRTDQSSPALHSEGGTGKAPCQTRKKKPDPNFEFLFHGLQKNEKEDHAVNSHPVWYFVTAA